MKRAAGVLWLIFQFFALVAYFSPLQAQTAHPTTDARYFATYSVSAPAGMTARVVQIPVDFTELFQTAGATGTILPASIHAYEATGDVLGQEVPIQFEPGTTATVGTLYLYVGGLSTTSNSNKTYRMYFDSQGTYPAYAPPGGMTIEEGITYQNAPSMRIQGPQQSYIYDMAGAGMTAIIDAQGNDWISHSTQAGGDGMYRGIPNVIEPEGGFHAGDTTMTSALVTKGPVKATVKATGFGGAWVGHYDFYPTHATFTITKAAHAYWLLYEGTPGGTFDPGSDYIIRSNGTKTMGSQSWDGDIPAPEWAIFADGTLDRSLFMYLKDDDSTGDSFWPMGNQMTVFGIGRVGAPLIQKVPNTLAFGLLQTRDYTSAKTQLTSVFSTPSTTLEGVSIKGENNPTSGPTAIPTSQPSCEKKLQGDADCNGTITLSDFSRWRDEYFSESGTTTGDFNDDARVTLADYQIWRTTYIGAALQ